MQDWSAAGDDDDCVNIRSIEPFAELIRDTICKEHKVNASLYEVRYVSTHSEGNEVVYFKPPYSKDGTFDLDHWLREGAKTGGFPLYKVASVVVVEPSRGSVSKDRYVKITYELLPNFGSTKKRVRDAVKMKVVSSEAEREALDAANKARKEGKKSAKDKALDEAIKKLEESDKEVEEEEEQPKAKKSRA
jgi:hypothetical protein